MNQPLYPPGPWVRSVAVSVETGLTHAAIFTEKSLNNHGAHFPLMVFDHQGTPSEGVANLVAAAPDLLDALRPLLEFATEANEGLPDGGHLSANIERARVAIAKAEGRS